MTTYTIYYNDTNGTRVTVDICPSLASARTGMCQIIDYQLGELCEGDRFGGAGELKSLKAHLMALSDNQFESHMRDYGITIYDVDDDGYLLINSLDYKTYYIDKDEVEG